MLERLAPETLDHILVLTYPPSPWPDLVDADKQRRQILRAVCLVSSLLRLHAQRLLWRKVVLDDVEQVERFQRAAKAQTELALLVRTIRVWGKAVDAVGEAARRCTALKKLQCRGGWLDWDDLGDLTIETLEVHNTSLRVPARPRPVGIVRFPLLATPSNEEDVLRLFSARVLPDLRALWLGTCQNRPFSSTSGGVIPSIPSAFASQLDMLQLTSSNTHVYVNGVALSDEVEHIFHIPTAVLLSKEFSSFRWSASLPPQAAHLRILCTSWRFYNETTFSNNIQALVDLVRRSSHLRSLALPFAFRPFLQLPRAEGGFTMEVLRDACAAKLVDVLWHDDDAEVSFSRGFWRYARRLRAE